MILYFIWFIDILYKMLKNYFVVGRFNSIYWIGLKRVLKLCVFYYIMIWVLFDFKMLVIKYFSNISMYDKNYIIRLIYFNFK